MAEVDEPGAGQFRIEDGVLDVRRRAQADREAVRTGGEGHVHVDTHQVGAQAFGVGEWACPVVRLLRQDLGRGAVVEARQVGEERVPVGRLARRAVHRILAQRAGVVLGVPLARRVRFAGAGRRVQGGHQLQTGQAVEPRGVITRAAARHPDSADALLIAAAMLGALVDVFHRQEIQGHAALLFAQSTAEGTAEHEQLRIALINAGAIETAYKDPHAGP